MSFARKIQEVIEKKKSHLVIGLDPDAERLFHEHQGLHLVYPGKSQDYILDAFSDMVIDAARETAAALKPQVAFFEAMGLSGLKSLLRCIRKCRELDLPVILDAKRGDIGNTARAYAEAYLNPRSEFYVDALTVNPYLGPDSLVPFVEASCQHGSGLFILVKTSNPGSKYLQDLAVENQDTVADRVARLVNEFSADDETGDEYSNIGAVIGATYPQDLARLRKALPRSIILVPGFGAQGGTTETIKPAFHPGGKGALVVSARSIIFAYQGLFPQNTAEGKWHPTADEISRIILEKAAITKNQIEAAISDDQCFYSP